MDFTNEFRVSLPPDQAWALLTDVERIAPCMPGAQLTGRDGDTYNGLVKVKVGPVTVQYKGTAAFEEQDAGSRTAVLRARGRDARGQGNADARITARLVPEGDATMVTVETRLTITGKIAQFGKGMIEEVSRKLLGRFVEALERQLAEERAPEPAAVGGGGVDTRAGEGGSELSAAAAVQAPAAAPSEAPAAENAGAGAGAAEAVAEETSQGGTEADVSDPAAGVEPAPAVERAPAPVRPTPEPEPIDLMGVARGAVLKRAIPAAVAVVVVVLLVVWLV
ncbi:SRPBCC family protein [Actinacidiphila glaucinigra]|uniref:SRPBCC family protein n=1 Tax=Actinacidiphila glaucinigra TaxID=235986 RepID=UPI002E328D50|nr:SRPBCC family protein [Actinacidiphila glaucinigra]